MTVTPSDIEALDVSANMKVAVACVALVNRKAYYGGSPEDCLIGQIACSIEPDPMSMTYTVCTWSGADAEAVKDIFSRVARMPFIFNYEAAFEYACERLGVDLDTARAVAAVLERAKEEGS